MLWCDWLARNSVVCHFAASAGVPVIRQPMHAITATVNTSPSPQPNGGQRLNSYHESICLRR
jgi:hypothetical protein